VTIADRPETSPKPAIDIDFTAVALAVMIGDGIARDLLERLTEKRASDVAGAEKGSGSARPVTRW